VKPRTTLLDMSDRERSAIVSRFVAGDTIALLAWDYDCHELTVEYVVREALKAKRKRGGKA
jgi:hypothetical protein